MEHIKDYQKFETAFKAYIGYELDEFIKDLFEHQEDIGEPIESYDEDSIIDCKDFIIDNQRYLSFIEDNKELFTGDVSEFVKKYIQDFDLDKFAEIRGVYE